MTVDPSTSRSARTMSASSSQHQLRFELFNYPNPLPLKSTLQHPAICPVPRAASHTLLLPLTLSPCTSLYAAHSDTHTHTFCRTLSFCVMNHGNRFCPPSRGLHLVSCFLSRCAAGKSTPTPKPRPLRGATTGLSTKISRCHQHRALSLAARSRTG